jgi:LacI family transcriptional regulator
MRGRRFGRSRMLGLIICDITNPFFPELVKHFEDQAVQKGLEVIIANTDYKPKRMAECIAAWSNARSTELRS